MVVRRPWIVTLLPILCLSSQVASQCIYNLSPSVRSTFLQVLRIEDRTELNGIPLTSTLSETEEAPVSWGMTTDPQGHVTIAESGQGFALNFNPSGDPDKFEGQAGDTWNLFTPSQLVPDINVDKLDKRLSLVYQFPQNPMLVRFSPSGERAAVFMTQNPDGVIGYVLDHPLDLAKQKVRVIREFPELQTTGPYPGVTWLSETELVMCILAPGTLLKITLNSDPTSDAYDVEVMHESLDRLYWSVWYDAAEDELYVGCVEKGDCIDVFDRSGRNIKRRLSGRGSGSVLDMKVYNETLMISGRSMSIKTLNKKTFEAIDDYGDILADDITSFAVTACPAVDVNPSASSGSDNKYLPLYIVIAVGVVGIVATLMFAVVLRSRAKRIREEGEAQSKGYRPDESFFTDLVGVRRDPVVPVVPSFEDESPKLDDTPYVEIKPSDTMVHFTALRQQLAAVLGDSGSNSKSAEMLSLDSYTPNTMSSDIGADSSLEEGRRPRKHSKPTPGFIGAFQTVTGSSISNAAASGGALYQRITRIPPEDVDIQGYVGSGGFADVFLGIWKEIPVAVKILRDGTSESAAEQFKKELFILTQLRHPNVTLMMGAMEGKRLAMVTEYLEGGSLHNTLRSYRDNGKRLPLGWVYTIARDIACGLLYLHTRTPPLVHRDIKSANIFLDKHGRAHVGDFGLSKEILSASRSMTQVVGTPAWMAPELVQVGDSPENYTTKVDVYAYAVTVFEMVAMCEPFEGESTITTLRAVVRNADTRPTFPEGSHALWKSFIESVWVTNPADRPDFSWIVEYLTKNEQALRNGEGAATLPPPMPRISSVETYSKDTEAAPMPSLVGVSIASTVNDGTYYGGTEVPEGKDMMTQDSSSLVVTRSLETDTTIRAPTRHVT